ncbi:hypothetical protein Q3G72_000689 [Acer saccharum]|nr:hypothetical protein Q3G72_000689 [Acer saccharum]
MLGINTLLQTLIGTRLPTVMGPSFASTLPVLSIMNDYSDENFSNGHEQKGSLTHIILYKNEVTSQTTHWKNHGPPTIDQQPNRLRFVPVEARGIDRSQGLQPRVLSVGDELNTFSSEVVPVVFADGSPSGGPRLSFATGVWIDKSLSFKDSYKQVVDNVYKAASNQVDFQTKAVEVIQEVNSWAEKETSGLIKEVLPSGSVDSLSRLILANALYFKGAWDEKFDASKTKDHDFHLLSGSSVQELGVVLPFSGGDGLTEMVDSPVASYLHVSRIFHKSIIEVNEEGTEAAAASAAVIAYGLSLNFVADHPFVFLIREDMTGMVMLVGHVLNPLVA